MNNYRSIALSVRALQSPLAVILMIAVVLWATGLPWAWVPSSARAAALTFFSDTLSDSDLNVGSDHAFEFTITNALDADDVIDIHFDPIGSLFTINNLGVSDFTATSGVAFVTACTGSPSEVTVSTSTAEHVTLTVCTGDTIAAGAKAFTMDNAKITNPNAVGSRVIRIQTWDEGVSTAILDQGDTRVAIIDNVVVTASVDTSFTFIIAGLANGIDINGTTTSTTTTAVLLDFGTLQPGVPVTLGQQLTVATNARNGFTVTVEQDQNLTSQTGADIDLFIDGTTTVPTAWQPPGNDLDEEWSYGHIGVTSEDLSLSSGDFFGATLYSGAFASTTPLEVFYHTGPADGVTEHRGLTQVAYTIQISALQEAGTDYTNTLTYIATPTF